MIGNIFAGIVVVVLIAAGVCMWWMENGPSPRDDAKEDTAKKDSEKKDSAKNEKE